LLQVGVSQDRLIQIQNLAQTGESTSRGWKEHVSSSAQAQGKNHLRIKAVDILKDFELAFSRESGSEVG
jgi:hypothetical protein